MAETRAWHQPGTAVSYINEGRTWSTCPAGRDDPADLLDLALVTEALGNETGTLPLYRRAIFLKPEPEELAYAHRGMGDVFQKLKKGAQAAAAYQQAVTVYQRGLQATSADVPLLQHGLGHAYLGLGQKDRAMQVHRKLVTLDTQLAQQLRDEINKAP